MARWFVLVAAAAVDIGRASPGVWELNATSYAERHAKWAALVDSMNGPRPATCQRDMRGSMPACHQYGDMWCWATGVTELAAYYKGDVSCSFECSVVGWCPKPGKDMDCPSEHIQCCPLSAHEDCGSDGATYNMLLESAEHFTGRQFQVYNGPMPPDVLDKTLAGGTPILMLIGQGSHASHVVSVAGCGNGSYFYHDPETEEGRFDNVDYNGLLVPQPRWAWIDTVFASPNEVIV
eukprot:TRINITY_DN48314_c0_g1_i1.p1 TRINITY_DN48314_c0_g1~~TRINITY_DN48314_c0_g1_i1.p1  ORF type:complete len:249 (+),score=26.79 TRINITY_DN48314_c0_g1_i1:44-748(+)